MSAIRIRCIRH